MIAKIDVMIVRAAVFMAGKVSAIATTAARVDGFGRETFGYYRLEK